MRRGPGRAALALSIACLLMPVPGPLQAAGSSGFSFKVSSLSGGTLTDNDFRGKILIVDIWATWCGPCRLVIPHLLRLQEKYKANGVAILGLNADNDPAPGPGRDAIMRFVTELGISYPTGLMNAQTYAEVARVMGSSHESGFSLPTTIVVSRDGRVLRRYPGYFHGQEAELEAVIAEILESEVDAVTAKP